MKTKNMHMEELIYGSNKVHDDSADTIINRCKEVSSNFQKIQAGELL